MVRGENKALDPSVSQEPPGRPQLLHQLIEDGGAEPVLSGPVDLLAVDHHQLGPGDRLLETRGVTGDHVFKRQPGTSGPANALVHGAFAALDVRDLKDV